jgi:hypothetical protein
MPAKAPPGRPLAGSYTPAAGAAHDNEVVGEGHHTDVR